MADLSEYALETLREGRDFVMYRGREKDGPISVLIVVQASEFASVNPSRLEHEYSFADILEPAWSARPLSFERHNGRATLILEDPGGDLLDGITGSPMELRRFLRIAISLAAALRQLHWLGIVHREIKPANVIVNEAGEVRLTGFGSASR